MSSPLQEHIEYLSIKGRFDLFETALANVIHEGAKVADLGCGVGVLGLQCLKAGASHVYGIDASDAIYLARETMQRAGLSGQYTCISGSTFDTELPCRVDALVCDHIGYFGFDYGLIDMIRDAALRMLKPGGVIVPDRLKLHVAAVSSQKMRNLASAWNAEHMPDQYRWLDEQNRNQKFSAQLAGKDLCSAPSVIAEIVLNADTPQFLSLDTILTVEESGQFDGIAGWFDCHLGGGVWMTNSPVETRGIERPQAFLPALKPFDVKAGDQIGVSLRFNSSGDMIAWTITPPPDEKGRASPQKLSTFGSAVLAPADLAKRTDQAVTLSKKGEARRYVLGLVDGSRTRDDITAITLAERPDLLSTEAAIREFVEGVIKRDCTSGALL